MPPPTAPYRYEAKAWKTGVTRIAGVDEAGRGPLAGPVVAAAVIIAPDRRIRGVADSKLLLPERREPLFALIQERAVAVGVGIVDHLTIDRINILEATRLAMGQALAALPTPPSWSSPISSRCASLVCPQRNLVDGDARCASVAAASIIAKVTRDRIMLEMDQEFPDTASSATRATPRPSTSRHRSPRPVPAAPPLVRERVAAGQLVFEVQTTEVAPATPRASGRPALAVVAAGPQSTTVLDIVVVGHGRRESGAVTDHRRTLGQAAEAEAARALQRAGFAVVERNVRFPEGEIDLVCRDDEVVVFVEVKCRRAGWDDSPAAAVSWRKQRRLTRLAQHYLKWRRLDGVRCRFDIVSVTVDTRGALDVRHVRSAFDATGG